MAAMLILAVVGVIVAIGGVHLLHNSGLHPGFIGTLVVLVGVAASSGIVIFGV